MAATRGTKGALWAAEGRIRPCSWGGGQCPRGPLTRPLCVNGACWIHLEVCAKPGADGHGAVSVGIPRGSAGERGGLPNRRERMQRGWATRDSRVSAEGPPAGPAPNPAKASLCCEHRKCFQSQKSCHTQLKASQVPFTRQLPSSQKKHQGSLRGGSVCLSSLSFCLSSCLPHHSVLPSLLFLLILSPVSSQTEESCPRLGS
uniref:Uncharacterized protein n=1 Tax=Myotis myotis TaxID=51298 RepID=A0A7J7Z4K7_MYOMY|nr:hypothetical protein mMyoMyo1_010434 [Myotis myotis]